MELFGANGGSIEDGWRKRRICSLVSLNGGRYAGGADGSGNWEKV
jgi:hypothetical protein